MAEQKYSFFRNEYKKLKDLPYETVGKIIVSVIKTFEGDEDLESYPKLTTLEEFAVVALLSQVQRNFDFTVSQSEKGKKGGAPVGNSNAKKGAENNPKTTQKQPPLDLKTTQKQARNVTERNVTIDVTERNVSGTHARELDLISYEQKYGKKKFSEYISKVKNFYEKKGMICSNVFETAEKWILEDLEKQEGSVNAYAAPKLDKPPSEYTYAEIFNTLYKRNEPPNWQPATEENKASLLEEWAEYIAKRQGEDNGIS